MRKVSCPRCLTRYEIPLETGKGYYHIDCKCGYSFDAIASIRLGDMINRERDQLAKSFLT